MIINSPMHRGNGRATDDLLEPMGPTQSGGIGGVLAIVVLGLAVFVTIGFIYLAFSDRMNGIDAWREKAVRDQRDGYKHTCEKKFEKLGALQEWVKSQKLKTSPQPELMVNDPCTQPDADLLNKPKEPN